MLGQNPADEQLQGLRQEGMTAGRYCLGKQDQPSIQPVRTPKDVRDRRHLHSRQGGVVVRFSGSESLYSRDRRL